MKFGGEKENASFAATRKFAGFFSKIFNFSKLSLFARKRSSFLAAKKSSDSEHLNKLEFFHSTETPAPKSSPATRVSNKEVEVEKLDLIKFSSSARSSPQKIPKTVSTSSSKSAPSQDKKRKESSNRATEDKEKDISEEDLDLYSENPRYVRKKEQEIRERRLAAGESLEEINKDLKEKRLQVQKKKGGASARSPIPPGGM